MGGGAVAHDGLDLLPQLRVELELVVCALYQLDCLFGEVPAFQLWALGFPPGFGRCAAGVAILHGWLWMLVGD